MIMANKEDKRVLFAVIFLKDDIFNCWQEYETWTKCNQATFLSWEEFKAFLRKSLEKSNAFISHT